MMCTINTVQCTISTVSSSDSLLHVVRGECQQQRTIRPQMMEHTEVRPRLSPSLVSGHLRCHPLHQSGLSPPST